MIVVSVEVGLILGLEDSLKGREFAHLLGAEVSGFIEHKAVAVAQNVGREPSRQTQVAHADDGRETALDQCLTRLEVLACNRHFGLLGQLPHGGNIDRGVGSTHDEGASLGQCSVGIAHRGCDVVSVIGLHGSLEGLDGAVILHVGSDIDFGRCGPEHDDAVNTCLCLEVADVLADLLGHVPAILALLDIVTIQTAGILLVKSGLERLDSLELVLDRVYVLLLEHLGVDSALIGVDGIDIPCCENDVVECGHRHDVLQVQIFLVSPTTHTNLVVLSHRANGLCQTFAYHKHASHERGAHCTQTNHHHTELAGCGLRC